MHGAAHIRGYIILYSMNNLSADTSSYSAICTDLCKGKCCDPWWGIISYIVKKDNGLLHLQSFREELIKGIREREQRIIDRYITTENPPRHLFKSPERYNVSIENIKVIGNSLHINLRAMFAFRCQFLSEDKMCTIHPAITGGNDLRPEHCAYLGSLDARPDERGYCRIIHTAAASSGDISKIKAAIEMEQGVSEKFYNEGCKSAEMAVDAVLEKLKEYVRENAPQLLSIETQKNPGRNDPCYCSSGRKFKKCHGM